MKQARVIPMHGMSEANSAHAYRRLAASIQAKLLFLICAILIPILVAQAALYYARFQARRGEEFQVNLEVARASALIFGDFVQDILREELAVGMAFTSSKPLDDRQMQRFLGASMGSCAAVESFTWISPQGIVLASTNPGAGHRDLSKMPFFSEIDAGKEWVLGNLVKSEQTGNPTFSISRAIRDETGTMLGIVTAELAPDRLNEILAVDRGKRGEISLLDKEGWLVYSYPEKTREWEQRDWLRSHPIIREVLAGQEVTAVIGSTSNGRSHIVALSPIRSTGWVVCASRPEDEVLAPIRSYLGRQALFFLLVTGAAFLLALSISKRITRPIKKLRAHALALASGKVQEKIEIHGPIELEDFARVFDSMSRSICLREDALIQARDELEAKVLERTAKLAEANVALEAEIAERKQIEAMLRLDEARLEALWQLSQMADSSVDQTAEFALDQLVRLTRSKIGWIGFMARNETTAVSQIFSKSTMQECTVAEDAVHLPVENAGIWADAVREKRAIVINDYGAPGGMARGYPQGHLPLTRLMAIPLFENDRIVAVAAVGNKEEEYNPSDARQLTLLMDGMWKVMERERAEKALRESERLAGMGRALSAAAHEMKTPLIAIGGFARVAQRKMEKSNPAWENLEIVIKEVRRLEGLVKDMLDFSRPLDLERSTVDMNRLVSECLSVVESVAAEKRVTVQHRAPQESLTACLDPFRIKQVFINLLTNAVQASPEGEGVVLNVNADGGGLIIEVADCGCGIPVDKREEIFSPFFTTRKEGTGLGLAIVKKIIEAHKGSIEILDNQEKGTIVRVVLPLES